MTALVRDSPGNGVTMATKSRAQEPLVCLTHRSNLVLRLGGGGGVEGVAGLGGTCPMFWYPL